MKNDFEAVLGGLELPETEIDVARSKEQVVDPVSFEDVIDTEENQMLVEGVAELEDHPNLETFLRQLNDLKNDFVFKVKGISKEFELHGSVKVLFSISREKD